MTPTKETFQATTDLTEQMITLINLRFDKADERLDKVDARFDRMDEQFLQVNERFDQIESHLSMSDFRQNTMSKQLKELQLNQQLFEIKTEKRFDQLQDSVDTIVEILKSYDMVPPKRAVK